MAAAERTYDWASAEHVEAVVATDPERRFGRDERDRPVVRAADGHEVTKRGRSVCTTDRVPPAYLRIREA